MNPFSYQRVASPEDALGALAGSSGHRFIAGGTNLLDLMKEGVERPEHLIDIRGLDLATIEPIRDERGEGGTALLIGALATNTDTANHPRVRSELPVLAEALLSGASQQLRNAASVGGNLLQRTRCPYFTNTAHPSCNKRKPGSGCGARGGYQRYHAIFGASPACIAVHPSDMAVALAALDATVVVRDAGGGGRRIPLGEFHRLPGEHPEQDTTLHPDELITVVEVPLTPLARRSHYLKVRDRASYAFALVSVAVAVETGTNGAVSAARVVLGGVAAKPWRCQAAEAELIGGRLDDAKVLDRAARAAVAGAEPLPGNAYKVALAKDALRTALNTLAAEESRA